MKSLMTVFAIVLFLTQISHGGDQVVPAYDTPSYCEVYDEQGSVIEELDYEFGLLKNLATERSYSIEDGVTYPGGMQKIYGTVLGVSVIGTGSTDWAMEVQVENGFFDGTLFVTTTNLMGSDTNTYAIKCL